MRKIIINIVLFSLIGIFVFTGTAYAPWIWTPETKKFVNPKNAVKDTPKEQFEWAMSFYNAKDYQRALFEFDKLAKQYEFSDYASKAQYYVGLCYEDMQKYYMAFENYQKAIDNFPHLANMDEVLAREYAIGLIYLDKPSPKIMGNDLMPPLDRAVEIFKKVVENAPYGKYAEDAQLKLGEALKRSERYEEAMQAYHKLIEDYPNSKVAAQAMYEESNCAYKASLKPAYDATATDKAIKTFEKFTDKNKDAKLAEEADRTMKRLKDNVAEKSFKAAQFYESQGKVQSAIIYYQDVIDTYPDSSFVEKARMKIEALKNPPVKKLPVPFFVDKKKPKPQAVKSGVVREAKPVVQEKKPWSPFNFSSKPQENKKAPEKKSWNLFGLGAKKEPVIKEPAKKKEWTPLNFSSKKEEVIPQAQEAPKVEPTPQVTEPPKVEPAPQVAEPPVAESPKVEPKAEPAPQVVEPQKKEEVAPQAKETPKKKSWTPFNFDNKKEPVVKEQEHPKKRSSWNPFNFGGKKDTATKEPAKKKEWKPLNFNTKKEGADKEAPAEKGWKPLNFDDKESGEKEWKPLDLDKV